MRVRAEKCGPARRYIHRLAALFSIGVGLSCQDSLAPLSGETIIVSNQAPGLALVSAELARVVGRIQPIDAYKSSFARSPDSTTLYFVGGSDLIALDTRSFDIRWRERRISDGVRRFLKDGIEIYGVGATGVSPDGSRLFVSGAYLGLAEAGVPSGIAVLDAGNRARAGFVDSLFVIDNGLFALPPGPVAAGGAMVAVGRRLQRAKPFLDWLFVIDPLTLRIVDSAAVAPPVTGCCSIDFAIPAKDGRHVYVSGSSTLYKFDLLTHQIVATARPTNGFLTLSPDGQTLYVTDYGIQVELPGSGRISVYSGDLEPQGYIDISESAAVNGAPPTTWHAAVSRDGSRLYVTSGTSHIAGNFGEQPARLLIVDVVKRQLIKAVPLGDWSPADLFVR